MMHPMSPTDAIIHNEGYAPKSNNIEMQSLFQREDDTDNDDCSINNNHDDDQLGGAPALASTSSGSSCSDYNDNHNKAAGGSLLNNQYPPQHRIDYSHNYTNGAPPLHKGPSSSNNSSNPPSSILSVTTNNNIGHAITPLHNIQYVHGGYAAAAPLFVTHSKFASVLKRLLPGAYVELKGLLHRGDDTAGGNGNTNNNNGGNNNSGPDLLREYSLKNDLIDDSLTNPSIHRHSTSSTTSTNLHTNLNHTPNNNNLNSNNNNICITDPVKIMKWAENNPIVSAFGIWNSDNGRRTKRFMQGVVVVKHQTTQPQQEGEQQEGEVLVNQVDVDGDGSPLRRRLKERIDRSRSPKRNHTKVNDTTTTTSSNQQKKDVIDEQHLTSLLQSLSTNYSSASNEDDQFDLSFRDRGNSSVVEAVTNDNGTTGSGGGVGSSTQQRLLRNYQQHHQQQRKREMGGTSAAAGASSMLPPLPPQITNSTRYSPIRSATPPPPPGSTLLKGGGMSGPGGVSSPRRKVPLPSDLPNSTAATEGTNSEHTNGIKRSRSRSLSLTNTSYDAYLNEHRQHSNHPYNRQRTSSSSSNYLDPTTDLLHQEPPKQHYNKPAIEWDIFLDPQLVRLVDAALTVVDELETKLHRIRLKRERIRQQRRKEREEKRYQRKKREEMMKRMRMNGGGFGLAKSAVAEDDSDTATSEDDEDEDFDLLQAHTAAQVEVDRLVAQLMRRTIIAHGSMSQLVLEGLGWAPEYNFGRVVKNSREGTNLPSPQRRNGHRHNNFNGGGGQGGRSQKKDYLSTSLSFSETLSWDEDEEQRDFEALLDRRIHSSSVGSATGGGAANTGKGGSSSSGTHNSKGMFMEKWLSLFAKSLSLLVRSTNSSSSGGDTDGGDGSNDIVKMSSSSLSASLKKKKKKNANAQLVKKKKKKSVAKKPEEQGFTCYLSSLFFGPGKSSNTVDEEDDSDNDKENDNNDDDDDNSAHLTNNDMFSPATTTPKGGILDAFGCGMSLCLGMDDDEGRFNCGTSTGQTSNSVFPLNPHASHQMARDIQRIHDVLGEPLRLVLDLKSRRVPPRVWSRLIDNLRSRGLLIEGIGSFDMDELRVIGKGCSYPLTPILFFHSVGDLQRACHANEVKKGDTVYFNGGSLMWKRSSIMEAAECGGCCGQIKDVDDESDITHSNNSYGRTSSTATAATTSARTLNANGDYSFQPYAYPRSALSDWERVQCKSTIEDYRRHFDLKIGVYVQEFSISAEALEELTVFVNQHGDLYDQGIAFGGVNGVAVKNISGDGYWNQRYMGRSWDFNARPSKEMTPLKPEDHHLVQVAIQAGAWGQVGTIYEVNDEQTGALTVPPPREPCMHIGID